MTLLGALFVAFLGATVNGEITTFFLNELHALGRPDLLLLFTRSNRRADLPQTDEFWNQHERIS
jgi:hypothetical protein